MLKASECVREGERGLRLRILDVGFRVVSMELPGVDPTSLLQKCSSGTPIYVTKGIASQELMHYDHKRFYDRPTFS